MHILSYGYRDCPLFRHAMGFGCWLGKTRNVQWPLGKPYRVFASKLSILWILSLQAQAQGIKSKLLDHPILGLYTLLVLLLCTGSYISLTAIHFFFSALFVFFTFAFSKVISPDNTNTSQIRSGLELEFYEDPPAKLGVKTKLVWVPKCNLCIFFSSLA